MRLITVVLMRPDHWLNTLLIGTIEISETMKQGTADLPKQ
jgi:hypothetical protein